MKNAHAAALCLAIATLPGCLGFGEKERAQETLRVINVLDDDLYRDAHIKGSTHVPFDQVESKATSWDTKIPVVFYCSNYQCSASGELAKRLAKRGFTTYAYEGGMAEWYQRSKQDKSYAFEGPAQESYLTMVIEPLAEKDEALKTITAEELKKMMHDAGLL